MSRNSNNTRPSTDGMRDSPESPTPETVDWKGQVSQSLQSGLLESFESESMADISIKVEGRTFRCHRVVLAALSPYFRYCPLFYLTFVNVDFITILMHLVFGLSMAILQKKKNKKNNP